MENLIIPFYPSASKLLVKSKGCYQYDADGKEYIDFESGVWCTNLGHNHSRINKVIEQQLRESIHHGYKFRNQVSEELARKLHEKVEISGGQSVFLSSGSEAVNLAITLSMHLTGRDKIVKIDNSYLSAFGFGQISSVNKFKVDIQMDDFDSIPKIDFTQISAFVIETGGASVDMVQFPDKNFMVQMVNSAKEHGCLIIADEVTTGFGRMGEWFGFQHYHVKPDIIVTGKALGNGYPVSAVTITSTIADDFARNFFRYAQSHQNDPLGCSVGLEVIRIIEEEKLVSRSKDTGKYFQEQLVRIKELYPDKTKSVRARGLMLSLEFSERMNGDWMNNQLFEKGFVVGYKANVLRFLPPLIIEKEQIDKLVEMIERLIIEYIKHD